MPLSDFPEIQPLSGGATTEQIVEKVNELVRQYNRMRPTNTPDVQYRVNDFGTTAVVPRLDQITISHSLSLDCSADPPVITGDISITVGDG